MNKIRLRLYIIETEYYGKKQFKGFLVTARSKEEARKLCSERGKPFGQYETFMDKSYSTCELIGFPKNKNTNTPMILFDSFIPPKINNPYDTRREASK